MNKLEYKPYEIRGGMRWTNQNKFYEIEEARQIDHWAEKWKKRT
jgi:hypothetical protein